MKISFDSLTVEKSYIHQELLESLTGEVINNAKTTRSFDVHILVNGEKLEPNFLNNFMKNIEHYIKSEAESILNDKLSKLEDKMYNVSNIMDKTIQELKQQIEDDLN